MSKRIALLTGSGHGRTAHALLKESWCYEGDVVLVASSHADSPVLQEAAKLGIQTAAIPKQDSEAVLERELAARGVDLLCLCGYMRLLSPDFVRRRPEGILNVHPALLPAFPGKDPQAQALAYGVRFSGTTIHFVTEGTDDGPIILQETCLVFDTDTLERLTDRLREASCRIYPQTIRIVSSGAYRLEGRKVVLL